MDADEFALPTAFAFTTGMSQVIHVHHHFWNYSPAEYGWVDDGKKILRRDFGPADSNAAIAPANVNGVISVQRQTIEETDWWPGPRRATRFHSRRCWLGAVDRFGSS